MADFIGASIVGDVSQRLVLVLLHSLWQGALAVVLLKILLHWIPPRYSNLRCALSIATLCGIFLGCGVTWEVVSGLESGSRSAAAMKIESPPDANARSVTSFPTGESRTFPAADSSTGPPGRQHFIGRLSHPRLWADLLACAWILGALVMLSKTAGRLSDAAQIRKDARPMKEPRILQAARELSLRLGLRGGSVPMLTSDRIDSPGVMGILKPVLLFPAAMATGLNESQMRAVLAHELAHLRRHDYLINVLQMIAESLFYFNPFVWIVSRQIRIEREAACDALAAKAMGDALGYSEALVAIARRWLSPARGFTVLQAMKGDGGPSGLLDRIKRLMESGYRSQLHVRWTGFFGVLAIAGLMLTAIYLTSNGAVRLAERILSHEERIHRIQEAGKEYDVTEPDESSENETVTISGRIRAADGSPLPEESGFPLSAESSSPGYQAGYSIRVESGAFKKEVRKGRIYLCARYEGWAPSFAGPLIVKPGESSVDGIELTIDKGFDARIRMTDEMGDPIPGIRVEGAFLYEDEIRGPRIEGVSDANGYIEIKHATEQAPLMLEAAADGYEWDERKDIRLRPDKTFAWSMNSSQPVEGRVVSKRTGQPVEGAEIKLMHRDAPGSERDFSAYDLTHTTTRAVTDSDGRFQLKQLRADSLYDFVVHAEGHRLEWLRNVKAGGGPRQVDMEGPLLVRGIVKGALDMLQKDAKTGQPKIYYSQSWRRNGSTSHSASGWAAVAVENGVGEFELSNLWEGSLRVAVPNNSKVIDLKNPIENIVIDLDNPDRWTNHRRVVFNLEPPEGAPAVEGEFAVRALEHLPQPHYPMPKELPVNNGKAEMSVEVPGRVMIEGIGLVGYWARTSSHIEVPKGEGPFEIRVPLEPAGAIFGDIVNEDGSPAEDASIHLVAERKPDSVGHHSNLTDLNNHVANQRHPRFKITPVPLGGVYRLIASRSHTYAVSDPIALTAADPIQSATLRLPTGITVDGRVLSPSGNPAPGVPLRLHYQTPYSHGFSPAKTFSDEKGRFEFSGVNPLAPGEYEVRVEMERDYQPASKKLAFDGEPIHFTLKKGLPLTGKVLEAGTGDSIPSAVVYVYAPGHNAETMTDEHGEFRFSNLMDATYHINVRNARLASEGVQEIRAGRPAPVELTVTIPEWSDLSGKRP